MDKKLLGLGILLIVTFVIYIGIAVFKIPIFSFTQAANENRTPSLSSSLIFAWPLEIKGDGKEKSEITVFIRDTTGKGIPERRVVLETTAGSIQGSPSITDSQGKATFYITSATIGVAQIDALVDNRKLQKNISVKFE